MHSKQIYNFVMQFIAQIYKCKNYLIFFIVMGNFQPESESHKNI